MRIVQVTGLLRVCSNKTLLQKRGNMSIMEFISPMDFQENDRCLF